MIEAIKELTINEGINPSDSTLVAGGGAGGLNIVPIAAELGCRTILVPRTAGALSASGMQFSDIVTEAGASKLTTTDNFDFDGVNAALADIDARLDAFAGRLRERGFAEVSKRYFVEARYRFQVWELEIEVGRARFADAADVGALIEAFHAMHDRVFAITDPGQAVECLNWRGRLIAHVKAPSLEPSRAGKTVRAEPHRRRPAYFAEGLLETPVYLGDELAADVVIEGPAIIEEATSTLVVNPGDRARVSAGGRYLLTPPAEAAL